jgi:hypothetical protein
LKGRAKRLGGRWAWRWDVEAGEGEGVKKVLRRGIRLLGFEEGQSELGYDNDVTGYAQGVLTETQGA